MTTEKREVITRISKDFFSGFDGTVNQIAGSGWLVADPLSGYLNAVGYKNELGELPPREGMPQILILRFFDGDIFVPAGSDLKTIDPRAHDWMWI